MIERFIQAVRTDDPAGEEPAGTRERLKGCFPPGAARRMTQLGMLVGSVLGELAPTSDDAIVYASGYGESRALEAFLDSFPTASPTLFQTSVHPSGVQQSLIGRQQHVPEVFPLSGGNCIAAQALLTAFLAPAPRAIVCGGEERGAQLREVGVAADRSFAFATAFVRNDFAESPGRIALEPVEASGTLTLWEWFNLLAGRRDFEGPVAPGWKLRLVWKKP